MRCCSTMSNLSALRMTPRMTSSSFGLRACIFLCFSVWNVCTDQPVWSLWEGVEGRTQLGKEGKHKTRALPHRPKLPRHRPTSGSPQGSLFHD